MKMEGKVLPGFRFYPTEEELVAFYLKKKVEGQDVCFDIIIGTLDLYSYDPWQLPDLAKPGEREWFFFVPRDKKQAANRRSRLTVSGYWKATGRDKPVRNKMFRCIGLRKTLVFYRGKAPSGEKTDWIMNEYRLPDVCPIMQKEVVLCRIHKKAISKKTLEQNAMEEEEESLNVSAPLNLVYCQRDYKLMNNESDSMGGGLSCVNKGDGKEEMLQCMSTLQESKLKLPQLQVPMFCVNGQGIVSPWTENSWTPSILLCTPKEDWNII